MNIEQLIADLRARVNPQYYDQIGTESYERHQVVKALEYLREENERQRFDTLAMNQSLDLMREENERLRKDATFAALRDEVNGLTGSLDRAEKALKEAQEQPAVAWLIHEYQGTGEKRLQFQPHIPSIRDDVTGPIVTALYARPVPANPIDFDRIKTVPAVAVPAVPTDEQIHAAYRKALGQSIRERDMPEIRKFSHSLLQSATQPSCWCRQCNPNLPMMILCPTCGNKRCPHANDHRNPCTGSNEPGQPGSAYPTTGDK